MPPYNPQRGEGLNWLDILAVGVYLALNVVVGIYATCKAKRNTVGGYYLAGRFMWWLPVGASLFASNIGSDHFIGLAGSGAASGIGVAAFELNALIFLQVLGWVFLPVFIASKVSTLPEYMNKRFGGQRIRIILAVLSIVLYIFTKLSVNLYAGALFIREVLGWNLYLSILVLLSITALCTLSGGLTAVLYLDTLQCAVMLFGASTVAIKSFMEVGGYSGLVERYKDAKPSMLLPNSTCGLPNENAWRMLRGPLDPDIPWPGFVFGQTFASLWYWCSDQLMVQRVLSAKSLSHAQGATLFTGYLKILPLFLIVMPGMISRVLYTDVIGCVVPEECERYCGSPSGCSNLAYPKLVLGILPPGMRGVMFAVMLAALMSDLTSVFNSASALFTMDLYSYFRRGAGQRELLTVGKLFVAVMIAVSIAWIPIILGMQGGQLFIYIQMVSAYLSPPVAAVYLIAVFCKRLNEKGAFWGLIVGFSAGFLRMMFDFAYVEPACGEEDTRPLLIRGVHYMYFALFLAVLSIVIGLLVSLCTEFPSDHQLRGTTYWTRFEQNDVISKEHMINGDKGHERYTRGGVDNYALDKDNIELDQTGTNGTSPNTNGAVLFAPTTTFTRSPSCPRKLVNALCGFSDDQGGRDKMAEREASEQQQRLADICQLKQDTTAKWFLNINLCVVLGVAVFMYLYYSV